jgi:putative membrane protein
LRSASGVQGPMREAKQRQAFVRPTPHSPREPFSPQPHRGEKVPKADEGASDETTSGRQKPCRAHGSLQPPSPVRCSLFAARSFRCSPLAAATTAYAHAGHHHLVAREVMTWWSWETSVVVPLAITALLYAFGLARLWRHAGRNHGIRVWQALAFVCGWGALVIALISPLDALGAILFSAHMAQHEILMIVAAPLLVLGRPLVAVLWALPSHARGPAARAVQTPPLAGLWRFATTPIVATVSHGLALWVWHLPTLYQATLRSEPIHALQHISFLGTAGLFWWTLIHGRFGRMGYGAGVLYVFVTSIHSGALGALLTFSPNIWYPIYQQTTAAWGLDAIEDQQLAGLIMWVPAGLILVVLGLALFSAWLAEAERRVAFTRSEALRETEKA